MDCKGIDDLDHHHAYDTVYTMSLDLTGLNTSYDY